MPSRATATCCREVPVRRSARTLVLPYPVSLPSRAPRRKAARAQCSTLATERARRVDRMEESGRARSCAKCPLAAFTDRHGVVHRWRGAGLRRSGSTWSSNACCLMLRGRLLQRVDRRERQLRARRAKRPCILSINGGGCRSSISMRDSNKASRRARLRDWTSRSVRVRSHRHDRRRPLAGSRAPAVASSAGVASGFLGEIPAARAHGLLRSAPPREERDDVARRRRGGRRTSSTIRHRIRRGDGRALVPTTIWPNTARRRRDVVALRVRRHRATTSSARPSTGAGGVAEQAPAIAYTGSISASRAGSA